MAYKVEISPDHENRVVNLYDLTNGELLESKDFFMPIYKHEDIFKVINTIGDSKVINFKQKPLYALKTRKPVLQSPFRQPLDIEEEVETELVPTDKKYFTKEAATKIGDYLGCSFIKWKKKWNVVQYDVWVKPINYHAQRFAFGKQRRPKRSAIETIWQMKDDLDECLEKGTYNISPFIYYFCMNPQELKQTFGKANWKRICKNSFSKNKKVAYCLHGGSNPRDYTILDVVEHFEKIKDVPSTAFDYYMTTLCYRTNKALWALNNSKIICDRNKFDRLTNLIQDTERMSRQLDGAEFNSNWSEKKMQKKHDEYRKIIDAREKGDSYFPFVGEVCEYMEFDGFEAHLLKTGVEVGEEGRKMRHCVGMYHRYCYKYEKMVYSITKNGERYSTLSFRIENIRSIDGNEDQFYKYFSKDQHYKMSNQRVDSQSAQQLEIMLMEKLNEDATANRTNDHVNCDTAIS